MAIVEELKRHTEKHVVRVKYRQQCRNFLPTLLVLVFTLLSLSRLCQGK